MKTRSIIEIKEYNNNKKVEFKLYQSIINKFIYLLFKTCSNTVFVVK